MALSVLLRWGADTQQTTRSGISALQLADQHVRKPRLRSLLFAGDTFCNIMGDFLIHIRLALATHLRA